MPFTPNRDIWYPDKTTPVAPLHTNFALLAQSVNNELKKVHYPVAVASVADAKSLPVGQSFYITNNNRYGYSVAPGDIRLYPLNIAAARIQSNGYSGAGLPPNNSEVIISSINMNIGDDVLATYTVSATIRVPGTDFNCAGNIILDINGQRTSFHWHSYGKSRDIDVSGTISSNLYGMTRGQTRIVAVLLAYCESTSQGTVQVLQTNSTLEATI